MAQNKLITIYSLIHHGDEDRDIGLEQSFKMFSKKFLIDYIENSYNIYSDSYEELELLEKLHDAVDILIEQREVYFNNEYYYIYVNQVKKVKEEEY